MSDEPAPSILYVDDDEMNRTLLAQVLRQQGFQTREAATGNEALRLAAERPDLIILDVNLPDMDGFEVCRRIKTHPATAAIPVLHMSGVYVRSEDRTQGLEGGADGYLTKPVEAREVVATVRALLRLHQAEEAARRSALQWQATFDAIRDALWLLDGEGVVLRCNRGMAGLLGRPCGELAGQPAAGLLRTAFGPDADPLAVLPLAEPVRQERELRLGGRWLEVTSDPVLDEHGQVIGRVQLLADVTRRRGLEERLRQAEKMEAVGRLAGGVAHDFNNLLTIITGNLALLGRRLGEDPALETVRMAEQASWRAAELTGQLLRFARQAPIWLKPVHLGTCVRDTVNLLRRTLEPAIAVEVRCPDELWPVEADPSQISQVLMNLCLNARDAMPTGGRLLVEASNVTVADAPGVEAAAARGGARARTGPCVRLRVQDSGHGIAPEVRAHVFEPFFTTKEVGKGTGLGLATVFGIVQHHRGWVECSSTPGAGACFDVYLPRYVPGRRLDAPADPGDHGEIEAGKPSPPS